jgi:hypothetical protein
MKTKLSLFVSVLGSALFVMGCVSPPPYSDGAFSKFGTWKKSGIGTGDSTGGRINIQLKDDLVLTSKAGSKCWGGLLSDFELKGDFELEVDMALEKWSHKAATAALCFPYNKTTAWTSDSLVIDVFNKRAETQKSYGVILLKDSRFIETKYTDVDADSISWKVNRTNGVVKVFSKEKGRWQLNYTYKTKLEKPFRIFFYLKNYDQYSKNQQDTPNLQIRFSNLKIKKPLNDHLR